MKAIQANPKTIYSIFQDAYIIPEFQRPYSWDEEECIQLFNDITGFYLEHKGSEENYYLGNIVLYPEKNNNKWVVIDGQQRLTTMMLFINALFDKARTATVLEECLKIKDPITAITTNELKIASRVIENDKEELEDIILRNNKEGKSKVKKNYARLSLSLEDWIDSNKLSAEDLNKFVYMVLYHIMLLPIECDSIDDALIIFNTLNNRGLPLSDADIFKAQLFKKVSADEKSKKMLIQRWNNLNDQEGDMESLFRILMHIKRAEKGDTTREIGLRKYFESEDKGLSVFSDWDKAMTSLEKIDFFYNYPFPALIKNLLRILNYVPNDYCLFPIYTFWYKNAELQEGVDNELSKEWILSEKKLQQLERLIKDTLKYYYSNAVAYNSVNAVKDITYKVCAAIASDQPYDAYYRKDEDKTLAIFENKIKLYEYGRCRQGLVFILAVLNSKQDQDILSNLSKWEVEHILPQKGYNNYNGWTEEEYDNYLNTLGNYVLLDKKRNIQASNEFFNKKKTYYRASEIQEAIEVSKLSDWTYAKWKDRNKQKEEELLNFFKENI